MITSKQVANYYNSTMFGYSLYHRSSNGIHYGYSDATTHGINEAIINMNRFLANTAQIEAGDTILDAGCGIGGSTIWLAQNYPIKRIVGISIASRQIAKARSLAAKAKLTDKVSFEVMDYLNTSFPDNTFDIVWALESVCYAKNKNDFLKEAYRVLKPGGKLILADGLLYHRAKIVEEKNILKIFYKGFFLNNIETFSGLEKGFVRAGYKKIRVQDITEMIKPSAHRLYIGGKIAYPFGLIGYKLGLLSDITANNAQTAMIQLKGLEIGLGGYGVFYGEKPK